jgi:hypothetical protein
MNKPDLLGRGSSRRPLSQKRQARACRSCGCRFVAAGAFERLCGACRKEAELAKPDDARPSRDPGEEKRP